MKPTPDLIEYLENWAKDLPDRRGIADIVRQLSLTSIEIANLISRQHFVELPEVDQTGHVEGDEQKPLDVFVNNMLIENLKATSIGAVASEENANEILVEEGNTLVVAIDPLDGSSNIETNSSIGTIFSILETRNSFNQTGQLSVAGCTGSNQVGSGFFIYGPQTSLVLTVRDGTHLFVFDPGSNKYLKVGDRISVPCNKSEFAINASNYRHWNSSIRGYIDDCLAGESGPREKNFNMRWPASMVADAYRILVRGGIYMYPSDARPGYAQGRLRLLYEAFPIALIMEQAGGAATDGINRILGMKLETLHQRIPLIFGSNDKVDRVRRYHADPTDSRYPLFNQRQLLRER